MKADLANCILIISEIKQEKACSISIRIRKFYYKK